MTTQRNGENTNVPRLPSVGVQTPPKPHRGPPGPPPRPGLQWKDETKRWVRPDGTEWDSGDASTRNRDAQRQTINTEAGADLTSVKDQWDEALAERYPDRQPKHVNLHRVAQLFAETADLAAQSWELQETLYDMGINGHLAQQLVAAEQARRAQREELEGAMVNNSPLEDHVEEPTLSEGLRAWEPSTQSVGKVGARPQQKVKQGVQRLGTRLKPALQELFQRSLEARQPTIYAKWPHGREMLGRYEPRGAGVPGVKLPARGLSESTVLHEVAHQLVDQEVAPRMVEAMTELWKRRIELELRPISSYATENVEEFIAESVAHYVTVPERLRRMSPTTYRVLRQTLFQ